MSNKFRLIYRKDIIPAVLCEGKNTKDFEPDFLLVNISHGHPKRNNFNIIKNYDFPVENRDE